MWIVQDAAARSPGVAAARRRTRTAARDAVRVVRPTPGAEPVGPFGPRGGRDGPVAASDGERGIGSRDHPGADDVTMSGSASREATADSRRTGCSTPRRPLTDTVHISGTARVTLRVASSEPAANLSVWLVTLPFDSSARGPRALRRRDARVGRHPEYKSLTAGGNYDSKRPGRPAAPGTFYDLTFDLEPDDEFVPAGKRLAVMIMSSDREFTLWPKPGTELTVDLAHSSFSIPIVGGAAALARAGAM